MNEKRIRRRIEDCPRLASLRSINTALTGLLKTEGSFTSEIAEVVKRDPTLTTRLLRLVNSVFYGLSTTVTNVEDAIIYLGMKQIRELAMATPVIEDFQSLYNNSGMKVDWEGFWQHSIGTAVITRDLLGIVNISSLNETDYVVGLVHNVGKLVMAFTFSEEFREVHSVPCGTTMEVCERERELIGWDHAKIGAYYLKQHQLPEHVVEAVEYHNTPEEAPEHKKISAVVQIAEMMVRSVGVMGIEDTDPVEDNAWKELTGWEMVIDEENTDTVFRIAELRHTLRRLPEILQGMVQKREAF